MRLFVDRLVDAALPVEQGIGKGDGESTQHDVIKELFRQNKKKTFLLRRTSLSFTSYDFLSNCEGSGSGCLKKEKEMECLFYHL